MASVQELLLAAEAKKRRSPLVDLLDTGIEGYQTGQAIKAKHLEITKNLLEIEKQREQKAREEKLRKDLQDTLAVQSEQGVRAGQADVGAPSQPATPSAKFETEWTQDSKGISRTIKEIKSPGEKLPEGYRKAANGRDLEYIPGGPADPNVKALLNKPQVDKSMQAQIAKARASLATIRPTVNLLSKELDRVQVLNKDSYGGITGAARLKAISAANLGSDNPTYKNTVDIIGTLKAQVAAMLKTTFGGQLSDSERQYLNEVYGAADNMSQTERDIAITRVKTIASRNLEVSQSALDELLTGSGQDAQTPPAEKPPSGDAKKIRVKRISDGQTGTINESDFDPAKYERV